MLRHPFSASRGNTVNHDHLSSEDNIDPAETSKFNGHAAQWWDRQGPLRTLHDINPVRLEFIQQHSRLQGEHFVDVGCGGGVLAESLVIEGATVTAIDLAEQAIETARLHALDSGLAIDYRVMGSWQLAAEEPAGYSGVTCMELLEHVPDPLAVVKDCAALLKPGGMAFFATLNRTPTAFAQAIIAAEHLLRLLPKGTHDYARLIRPSELSRWCRESGLEVTRIRGLGYNPLTHGARLRGDCSVNYLLAARKSSASS